MISHAADRQMAYVKTFQSGKYAEFVQKLLNDVASARICLLDPRRKAEYDTRLRASLGAPRWRHAAAGTSPVGVASSQRPAANRLQPIPVPSTPETPATIVTNTRSVTRRVGKRSPAWLPLAISGAVIGALLIGIVGLVMYLDQLSSRQENTESVAAAPTKSGQKAGQKEARSPKTVAEDSESAGGDPDSGDKADMTPAGGLETPSSDENEAEAASPGEEAASPGEAVTTPGEAVTSPAAEPAQAGPALSDTLAGETRSLTVGTRRSTPRSVFSSPVTSSSSRPAAPRTLGRLPA